MKVERVFISTYRYDFHFAKICIASIRYWYPDILIYLIKDENSGTFDTSHAEKLWNVQVLRSERKKFGWGYGKLEPLFLGDHKTFFVIDADAVITGPVFDLVKDVEADFVVDDEVQPQKRFNEIYYRLDRIHELDSEFHYPGYSFNTGQWFGTSSVLKRSDFDKTLNWSEPPSTKNNSIIFNNDQSHLNYVLHKREQLGTVKVAKKKMMIWPVEGNADFIKLERLKNRDAAFPFVIHWAGMSGVKFSLLPRQDILKFYRDYYYSKTSSIKRMADTVRKFLFNLEKKVLHRLKFR